MGPPHPDQALTQVKGNEKFLYLGAPPSGREVAAVCPGGRVPWTQVEQGVVVGETMLPGLLWRRCLHQRQNVGLPRTHAWASLQWAAMASSLW